LAGRDRTPYHRLIAHSLLDVTQVRFVIRNCHLLTWGNDGYESEFSPGHRPWPSTFTISLWSRVWGNAPADPVRSAHSRTDQLFRQRNTEPYRRFRGASQPPPLERI